MEFNLDNNRKSVSLGLAFIAGLGLTLMIIALGVGVVTGAEIGLWFISGLLLLIVGIVGWFGVVQPYKNFDDINVPHYHGHHDHDHHEETVTDLGVTDAEGHAEAQLH